MGGERGHRFPDDKAPLVVLPETVMDAGAHMMSAQRLKPRTAIYISEGTTANFAHIQTVTFMTRFAATYQDGELVLAEADRIVHTMLTGQSYLRLVTQGEWERPNFSLPALLKQYVPYAHEITADHRCFPALPEEVLAQGYLLLPPTQWRATRTLRGRGNASSASLGTRD